MSSFVAIKVLNLSSGFEKGARLTYEALAG